MEDRGTIGLSGTPRRSRVTKLFSRMAPTLEDLPNPPGSSEERNDKP